MKKIGILLLLSMVVLGTACKKDKKIVEPSKEELIVGDWDLESLASDDGLVIFNSDTTLFSLQSKNENYKFEFNENKSFTSTGTMILVTTATKSSGAQEVTESVIDTTSAGSWTIEGNNLIITEGSEVTESEILELTTDRLKIKSRAYDSVSYEIQTGVFVDLITSSTSISIFKK